jgi:uncharacterized caspase-like protein
MTKRAVVVGVNDYTTQFPDGKSNLAGCVNDAASAYHLLVDAFGFDPSQTYYYTDAAADRTTILQALRYILSTAETGDVACFFYAGHGARLAADPSNPATSKYYEAIIPASGDWITDWEINDLAAGLQPSMVNFTVILDSCNSGGFHESAPDSRTRTIDFTQQQVDAMVANMTTVVPCGVCLPADSTVMNDNVSLVKGNGNGVVCSVDDNKSLVPQSKSTVLAACRYDEVDIETGGHGALTQGLLDIVNATNFAISYTDLVDQLRTNVASHTLTQTPTLLGQENRVTEDFLAPWHDCR